MRMVDEDGEVDADVVVLYSEEGWKKDGTYHATEMDNQETLANGHAGYHTKIERAEQSADRSDF